MSEEGHSPKGQLLLRTLAMPSRHQCQRRYLRRLDHVSVGLSRRNLSKEISSGRVVTVSVSSITFKKPVSVGDVVCCYGVCSKIGRTSMSVDLEVWVKPVKVDGVEDRFMVCDATFNYVAIDSDGKPRPILK